MFIEEFGRGWKGLIEFPIFNSYTADNRNVRAVSGGFGLHN